MLTTNSPFIGAELAIKSKYKGFKVSEVGIHTYPRTFRSGSSVSFKNIVLTIKDMIKLFIKLKKMNLKNVEQKFFPLLMAISRLHPIFKT